jgi:putative SOS response-associated peptidase YedK
MEKDRHREAALRNRARRTGSDGAGRPVGELEWVRSFAILTTTPNELCAELHDRMPVVLGPEAWPAWLGEEPADPRELKALLAPYPSGGMTCWPVERANGERQEQ